LHAMSIHSLACQDGGCAVFVLARATSPPDKECVHRVYGLILEYYTRVYA
jgi:hypothetical protein